MRKVCVDCKILRKKFVLIAFEKFVLIAKKRFVLIARNLVLTGLNVAIDSFFYSTVLTLTIFLSHSDCAIFFVTIEIFLSTIIILRVMFLLFAFSS